MDEFLRALIAARVKRVPVPDVPLAGRPTSVAEGYAVQAALHRELGARGLGGIVGYKIGCTTPVMQEYLGITHPCAGGVFASTVHQEHAELSLGDFVSVGIECEIGVTIGRDMNDAASFGRDDVGDHVDACWASIEIVDNRYADYASLGAAGTIADDFFNAGLVAGRPCRDWRDIPLDGIAGTVTMNGVEAARGTGDMILGHPFEALAWLASMRSRDGTPLERGERVTLGSVVKTIWIDRPDTRVDIELERLGGCSVLFRA